jgi:hypothetical protein
MIHWTPSIGCVDHGLYNAQPGLFFDLAAANDYAIECIALCTGSEMRELKHRTDVRQLEDVREFANAYICCALRKQADTAFRMPLQGVYENTAAQIDNSPLVLPDPPPLRNLAIGRPALQSSTTNWSYNDDPSVDARGGNNGMITGHYGFHTGEEANPWWQVDLVEMVKIEEVRVYNRITGNCGYRAASLQILFSEDGQSWALVYENNGQEFGGADGKPLRVAFDQSAFARYVRVQLDGTGYLHLDEVEVYGICTTPPEHTTVTSRDIGRDAVR